MAFVVLIEQPLGKGPLKNSPRKHRVLPLIDEEQEVCQFPTAEAAKAAAVGHHWEHTWAWYVVELADGAVVQGM
jgi:hypothetical protein